MKKYHPEFDKPEIYTEAAKKIQDAELKLLLERAAATIAHLQKHMIGTQQLLAKMNNRIVNEGEDLTYGDLEQFFPDINNAIETCDDENCKFSTPYETWRHLQ